jgi:DNA-binding beta-propeller fold protein YncE
VRYGAGAVWVGNATGRNIWRIDPATNNARAVPTGLLGPDSLAVSPRGIWVAANSGDVVVRLNTRTLKVAARVKVGFHPGNPAFAGDGSVFVPVVGEGTVVRIDPARNKVVGTWRVGKNPFPALFAFGDIWVPVSGGTSLVRFHVG